MRLTARERQIALLVADGLSNKQVAERLAIAEGTVKIHLHNIYRKIGMQNWLLLPRSRAHVRGGTPWKELDVAVREIALVQTAQGENEGRRDDKEGWHGAVAAEECLPGLVMVVARSRSAFNRNQQLKALATATAAICSLISSRERSGRKSN